mmetsp:Transcript_15497/g.54059  ORF Transcript_15497/g.54059 Transcript_15497/m.54059 type:complete len:310 (+) Transcript_15497:718-1647(+)
MPTARPRSGATTRSARSMPSRRLALGTRALAETLTAKSAPPATRRCFTTQRQTRCSTSTRRTPQSSPRSSASSLRDFKCGWKTPRCRTSASRTRVSASSTGRSTCAKARRSSLKSTRASGSAALEAASGSPPPRGGGEPLAASKAADPEARVDFKLERLAFAHVLRPVDEAETRVRLAEVRQRGVFHPHLKSLRLDADERGDDCGVRLVEVLHLVCLWVVKQRLVAGGALLAVKVSANARVPKARRLDGMLRADLVVAPLLGRAVGICDDFEVERRRLLETQLVGLCVRHARRLQLETRRWRQREDVVK